MAIGGHHGSDAGIGNARTAKNCGISIAVRKNLIVLASHQ
ncbi:Unknown protein sequence [Pseudomonas savastanoi pv. glycinea]|nr:Unknown protein sequence [Pseudomonas savastanoi pv. glycinea]KPC50921.1 Unknown protein sequence [Pseudomonas savastanoi pv. glycinea]